MSYRVKETQDKIETCFLKILEEEIKPVDKSLILITTMQLPA